MDVTTNIYIFAVAEIETGYEKCQSRGERELGFFYGKRGII